MRATFFKGRLYRPALDKLNDHVSRLVVRRRRKVGSGLQLAFRVAHDHPADCQSRLADSIPDRRATTDFKFTSALVVPVHANPLPGGFLIFEHRLQGWQARALDARTPV